MSSKKLNIKIIATGSAGNAYLIEDGNESILIDPGIPFKKLQKACNFRLSYLSAVLVSHEHKDHSHCVKELCRLGLKIFMSLGTQEAIGINGTLYEHIRSMEEKEYCGWRFMAFDTIHDSNEPLGFLILSPSGFKILYAVDTCYIRYRFIGVTHYIVECNYSEQYLRENESLPESVKNRIRMNHFELSNVINFFNAQDLSRTESIHLIHASEDNGDPEMFREKIAAVAGVRVY